MLYWSRLSNLFHLRTAATGRGDDGFVLGLWIYEDQALARQIAEELRPGPGLWGHRARIGTQRVDLRL